MYNDNNFKSDLMNSYAWDTAVVFLQKFDNRVDKTKPYSRQNSLNTGSSPANQGTTNLESSHQDIICNIWDMASNCHEWTTETCNYTPYSCTISGGSYVFGGYYTSCRDHGKTDYSIDYIAFRPILYM